MIAKIEVMMDDIWDLPPILALSLTQGTHVSVETSLLEASDFGFTYRLLVMDPNAGTHPVPVQKLTAKFDAPVVARLMSNLA
jgi:hypothetical protein